MGGATGRICGRMDDPQVPGTQTKEKDIPKKKRIMKLTSRSHWR